MNNFEFLASLLNYFLLKNWAVAAIIDKCIAIDEMPRTLEWYCVMIAHTVRKLINNPIKQIETFLSRLSSYKTCFMSRKTTKKSHFIREYSEWALEADERFSLFHSQGSKIKRLKLFYPSRPCCLIQHLD